MVSGRKTLSAPDGICEWSLENRKPALMQCVVCSYEKDKGHRLVSTSEKTDTLCLKMAVTSPGAGVEAKDTLHSEPLQRSQALASISTTEYVLFTSPSLEYFFRSTDFF